MDMLCHYQLHALALDACWLILTYSHLLRLVRRWCSPAGARSGDKTLARTQDQDLDQEGPDKEGLAKFVRLGNLPSYRYPERHDVKQLLSTPLLC